MPDIKVVKEESLHQTIAEFIKEGDIIIADIDEMKEVVCKMIKCGYMFAMDRDRLRDAIEDFVYMCQPNDEINKDRVMKSLEYDDEEDSDDDFEADYPQQLQQMMKCATPKKQESEESDSSPVEVAVAEEVKEEVTGPDKVESVESAEEVKEVEKEPEKVEEVLKE
tara:strand:- start:293 stop:790 length:498 start_codon:yes stop_codon:yes gene_type:complete